MNAHERLQLELQAQALRSVAASLKRHRQGALSLRASALAQELELKIQRLDAGNPR